MRIRTLLTAALLAAGLIAVPPADAALPALAGTTVVSGSGVGVLRVRIPAAVRMSTSPTANGTRSLHVAFQGGGRLLALVLVSERDRTQTWLMRSALCMTRGCTGRTVFTSRVVQGPERQEDEPDWALLPAGTYALHWVADGAPASVRLTMPGLRGTTSLRPPRRPGGLVYGPPRTVDTVDPVTSASVREYEGSTKAPLPAAGLLLVVSTVDGSGLSMNTACLVGDTTAPAPPGDVVCPVGSSGGMTGSGTVSTAVPKGDYVLDVHARYAGTFVATGLAIAVLPGL